MNKLPILPLETLTFSADFYTSPAPQASWLSKLFPSLAFYPQMAAILFHGYLQARKGLYGYKEWIRNSECVARLVERLGGQIEVEGLEVLHELPGPCVFIGNHMSTLETFMLPAIIQPWQNMTFVVKDKLMQYPLFGTLLGSREPVVVGRKNPREDLATVLEEGCKRLEQGISMVVFPQSTRTERFEPQNFNTIGIKLAKRAGVPVVPLALSTHFWSNGKRLKDFGKIYPKRTVHYALGSPMCIEGQGKQQHQAIVHFIKSKLAIWDPVAHLGLPA